MEFFTHKHPFMTVKQVAEALQVTAPTVHSLVQQGHLSTVTLPGIASLRIPTQDFVAFYQNAMKTAANQAQAPSATVRKGRTRNALPEEAETEVVRDAVKADGEFLSVKQVAQELMVNVSTVYKLMRKGELRWTKVPGMAKSFRIRTVDLAELQKRMHEHAETCFHNPEKAKQADVARHALEQVTMMTTTQVPSGAITQIDVVEAPTKRPPLKRGKKARGLEFFAELGASMN